jgi:hypothetical protein
LKAERQRIMRALFGSVPALALLLWTCPAQAAPSSPIASWLAEHECTRSIWNVQIGTLGHGTFHPEIPLTLATMQARYGQAGQRVNGSAGGGEWCTGDAVVGDDSTLGCWLANAGLPNGYHLTTEDVHDLAYVECKGVTACSYLRGELGGDRACSGASDELNGPSREPDGINKPRPGRSAPCPPLTAVPPDVRETVARLADWLPASKTGEDGAARIARVQAWLAVVDGYRPRVESTASMPLVLSPRCAP